MGPEFIATVVKAKKRKTLGVLIIFVITSGLAISQPLNIPNNGSYTTSGTESYSSLTLGNSAVLTVATGDTLNIYGDANSSNGFGIFVESGASLIITGTLTGNNNISLNITGSFTLGSFEISNNGSVTVGGSGTLTVNGDFSTGTGATISNDGTMTVDGSVDLGSGSTLDNDGSLSITGVYSGDTISGSGSSTYAIYSCDMETCGAEWDNNSFQDWSSYSGGCSGDGVMDNVYGSGAYSILTCYNDVAINGHNGGKINVSVKVKLRDYYSPYTDRSASEWGNLKIYYKTTSPSAGSPGTQIGSTITSSTDCETHTVSFTPGVTIADLYLAFVYDNEGVGDNWIIYDDVSVVEEKEASVNTWTGDSGNNSWTDIGNWSLGALPAVSSQVVIPDVALQPQITSSVTVGGLTINSGADLSILSNDLTVAGLFDLNGTLNIGNATVNADGTFDATGGQVNFTHDLGSLKLSSIVTSLGELDTINGTVEYNGESQAVLADNYYNLTISSSGTKIAAGDIDVNGDFQTAATATCKLDMGANNLTLGGNLTVGATDGLDLSDASCTLLFNGSIDQTVTHAGNTGSAGGPSTLLSEDFENGGSIPTGWTNTRVSGDADWQYTSGGNAGSNPSNSYAGSYNAVFWEDDFSGDKAMLISPVINFTGFSDNPTLSFYHVQKSWSGDVDSLTVYYRTSAVDSWKLLQIYTAAQSTWVQRTIALPSVNSTYYIAFRGSSNYGYGTAIDNVEVTGDAPASPGYEANNVTINKSSGNVILSSEFGLDGTLTLTSGDIDASSNNLVLTSNATVSGAGDASHVIGSVAKTTTSTSQFTFPIGDGTNYRPIAVTPSNTDETTWTANYQNSAYGTLAVNVPLQAVSEVEYWNLDRSGTATAAITLWWDENSTVNDLSDLRVAHYNSGTSQWENAGNTATTGNTTSGSVTSDTDWDSVFIS